IGILPIQNLALLGNAKFTREVASGLRKDRRVRWAAASPHSATSTMKQTQLYVARACYVMQFALGFMQFPGAGKHAAVFIRIGVTEHHLLPSPPRVEQRLVIRRRPELLHHTPGPSQRLDRFE